jgi:hypothetical protein
LTYLVRLQTRAFDIDPQQGPRASAPYIEQEASTLNYTRAFTSTPNRLKIIIKLLFRQAQHKVSDVGMEELFQILHEDVVPIEKDVKGNDIVNNMPLSRLEARKVIKEVGFDYVVIDACPCN